MPKNELIKPSVATNCSVTQKNFVKGKLNKALMYVYLIDTRKLQLSLSHKDFFLFHFYKTNACQNNYITWLNAS